MAKQEASSVPVENVWKNTIRRSFSSSEPIHTVAEPATSHSEISSSSFQQQHAQAPEKKRNRFPRKPLNQLAPAVQRMIPGLYQATGFDSERTAKEVGTRRQDVLDAVLASILRKGPGNAPAAQRPFLMRKGAA